MKTLSAKAKTSGFTLVELLAVLVIIAILAALLLPAKSGRGPSYRTRCMSQLKQIDLGFFMFAEDNGGKFPMQLPSTNGGTMELISRGHIFSSFQKLSTYSIRPTLFVCPIDHARQAATNYEMLNDLNISYFINADAPHTNNPSQTFFAGDCNLQSNHQVVKPGLLVVTTNIDLNWSSGLHSRGGNLAFADGHVEWSRTNELNSVVQRQPLATNRLCVP